MIYSLESLDRFKGLVLDRFGFLLESYGFSYFGAGAHIPEFWVSFRSSLVDITIMFEIGTGAWVELGRLEAGKKNPIERYALSFLIMERAPQGRADVYFLELDDPRFPSLLEEQAKYLRLYAEDVLKGDFKIFPRLRQLAEKRMMEKHEGQGFN